MKKLLIVLLIFSGSVHQSAAQLIVSPGQYRVDENLKLAVCNLNSTEITPGTVTQTIRLNAWYQFSTPVTSLKVGTMYTITRNNIPYRLYFTELPLIAVETQSAIADEPKVSGQLTVSDPSGLNFTSSMGIEIRGGSTQWYPKKSYDIELWQNSTGEQSRDASFFGMRNDDDWLLLCLYNESLRINNVFSHQLWLKMHSLYYSAAEPGAVSGVHTRFVELFVNGEYMGLYALAEQVDNKQLKLKKFSDGKTRGELYKGAWWGTPVMFKELIPYSNGYPYWGGYEFKFPEENIEWTNLYDFTDFIVNSTAEDFRENIFKRADKSNMIDYFIFLNLLRAQDNKGKNAYLARYTENQPYFYVPWDLDGVLGHDYGGGHDPSTTDTLSNGLFDRLFLENPENFRGDIQTRWFELRENILSIESLESGLDSCRSLLLVNNVYEREFLKWPGGYDESNVGYMRSWLGDRISYLDQFFESIAERDLSVHLNIYPNPSSGLVYIETKNAKGLADAHVVDARGVILLDASFHQGATETLDLSDLANGIYFLQVRTVSGLQVFKIALY